VTRLYQLKCVPVVDLEPFTLPIWANFSAHVRAFIPGQPKPAQGLDENVLVFRARSSLVRVLNAEQQFAAMDTREEKIEQSDEGGAHMRGSRG
jgi:hypothetical protein